ncbi:hypothetical protein SCALIN_C45_0091 [Candidatus Scalindua japonica]|uniref:Uncharacterized protein n=1 Tax=Candidatus Scalindua japonica TaxID=1284222 RepID=A0A286U478_9BACT|nr:heparinase II/III-family protein [Candidatus Scalindua japonica]GAX62933.1 hypothetical protein SCALIN_C45_0091 [Candidatus Scalindua japonica]
MSKVRIKKLRIKLLTFFRLGLINIVIVLVYRVLKRIGYYRYRLLIGLPLEGSLYSDEAMLTDKSVLLYYFLYHKMEVSSPPDWFVNPWSGSRYENVSCHWSDIPDFVPELGDIKTVWEASRFDWLPKMAWAYQQGDTESLKRLEFWLRDWAIRNPVNGGINWKCGQEASLRCLNLLVGALAINRVFEDPPHPAFLKLLYIHLQRIVPTVYYAMAQDNNHGISEAATLFIVGHYLSKNGNREQIEQGSKWARKGRYRLENRVAHLILADGSFSMHSVTYHRSILDVLSLTELMRSRLKISEFSDTYYSRAKLAVKWFYGMMDIQSGDAPNLGSNDGTHLFNLDGTPYRDFRPSLQLASALFLKRAIWVEEVTHPLLDLFSIDLNNLAPLKATSSKLFSEGGFARINHEAGFAMLRLPVYSFRPSHADALHLDVWYNGVNWIRDAGSYSYNVDDTSLEYFPGTESHSTVCFDGHDQMPRLGRFLFGAWLKPDVLEFDAQKGYVKSGYTDYLGSHHTRELRRAANGWRVVDDLGGFKKEAVIRWRLAPEKWLLDGQALSCDSVKLEINTEIAVVLKLTEQFESRYYLQKKLIPVLEVICHQPGRVVTHIQLA